MTKERKDSIAVVSACVMLIFGITLTAIGFAIEPTGDVSDSVLWILGQSLIYAGGIFGIATYTKNMVDRRVNEWRDEVRAKESEKQQEEEA
ncbi:MAG: hypothetical protein IK100_09445 [Muribaculaceae bacterium]|nr:hypothetical protein [Muribaculaceae bacterium]